MTTRQFYRECERLYAQINWNNKESVHRYNEKVRELRHMRDEEEERRKENEIRVGN